jgi:hypothetical protein
MHSALATIVFCLLAAQAPGLENANAASFDDAPTVRETAMFQAAIVVRNPYDRAVRVKQLDASCSCATLEIHDHFILPNATTVLDVAVKCANRSGNQGVHVSVYVTDPEFEPIEVDARWKVQACVQVDAVPPGADAKVRPADTSWQDIYRYVAQERPDEPNRLRKRIRLSCPPEETPAGGLKVAAIDYDGKLWQFSAIEQEGGSILILAKAKEGLDPLPEGEFHEQAVVHTNHPDKPTITLRFESLISKDVGAKVADPRGGGFGPAVPGDK